ncbi:DUF1802 family protein [Haloarculaceae archaeon H-GB2-1]|nr:DUF1802 family protein [Haloarculaceae archaeon H-GB11]MEA5408582.1 DUF1802 family protein [Haloarculaceae archaeon H-GB2-1]
MPPRDQLAALKERAGVVAALLDGRQTVLVRSSDLPPSTDDLADPFALYPSYSHQDPDRYGDRDLRYYHGSTTKPADGIPLRGVAEVEAVHHVETDRLASLTPYYVYTEAGLRDKYRLDDQAEARVLVVRTRELENPRLIEERGRTAAVERGSTSRTTSTSTRTTRRRSSTTPSSRNVGQPSRTRWNRTLPDGCASLLPRALTRCTANRR